MAQGRDAMMMAPAAADTLAAHEVLVAGLLRPDAYPHPVPGVERIDTHISTVLLAGERAYKLKKPVAFDFVDFSTIDRRRQSCIDEVRLNRRTAPQIYEDVVAVVGPRSAPRIVATAADEADEVIDYAVRMRRFDEAAVLARMARSGRLGATHIDLLAATIADFHRDAERVPGAALPAEVARWSDENIAFLRERAQSAHDRARLDALAQWAAAELRTHAVTMATRSAAGFVRDGHGDLHLGNIVAPDGVPVPFDAIEFNAGLRCIDVINDIAFTFMDLFDHELPRLAWRLIGAYVEHSGDHDGLALLRYYAVYRALVRAKIALIRQQQPHVAPHLRLHAQQSFAQYLALAERLCAPSPRVLVLMSGLSGSGKSTVAQRLAEGLGAIRVRSDVERKRLHGLAPAARSGGRIYGVAATQATYARLADVARTVLGAGLPVVVDAAFLKRDERAAFRALAADTGARPLLLECDAPPDVLRARVATRAERADDPSEAGPDVLERQFGWRELLADDERACARTIDTSVAGWEQQVDALADTLQRDAGGVAAPAHSL